MEIIKFLEYATKRYVSGTPVMTDAEFDKLADSVNFKTVGASVQHGVEHTSRMYSLQKFYIGEGEYPFSGNCVTTPKLDGAAVALTYFKGSLVRVLTRGDGKRGQDISHLIGSRVFIPLLIDTDEVLVQIIGEVVAPKTIENARNYAAGALNLKDKAEFNERDLSFVAYGISPSSNTTYEEDMDWLLHSGFINVFAPGLDIFPQDGKVVRLSSNKDFEAAGYTSTHPKGAYAIKERKAGVESTLLDVIWQVGKSGVVSPVGLIEPVKVGDAVVSRATLHNIKYINELNLEIGCKVEVVRAGDIIPRIVRRIDTKK